MQIKLRIICLAALLTAISFHATAQNLTNTVFPPYYAVRYEGSTNEAELKTGVTYTLWLPPGVQTLRGVIVHQHGCGVATGIGDGVEQVCDLQWQALAAKHECALLAPTYEQLSTNDCRWWSDPRNGSGDKFLQALADLSVQTYHPELEKVPWILWGHSGGASWVGTMFLLQPERVAAVWLRSSVPLNFAEPILPAALGVPVMCNLGVQEGITGTSNQFGFMWLRVREFFLEFRAQGGLVGVAVDPNSGHDCGNSRYLAIPWLDDCLAARLPEKAGEAKLKPMPADGAWLAPLLGQQAQPASKFIGDVKTAVWLPNERIAQAWSEFVKDGKVSDSTPPPSPRNVTIDSRRELSWDAQADLESGIAAFVIERDGKKLARVPEHHTGYFVGRATFQQIGYGDYPTTPLAQMRFTDKTARKGSRHTYTVRTVNTVGLQSAPATALLIAGSNSNHLAETTPHEIKFAQPPKSSAIQPRAIIKLETRLLDACVGLYEFAPTTVFPNGAKIKIWREGDQLMAQPHAGTNTIPPFPIYPESETNFFLKLDGAQETFVKNEKGEVTAVIHRSSHVGIRDSVGKKIN